jgi:hypothetical protein
MSVQGIKGNYFLTDDIILRKFMAVLKSSCVAVKRINRDLESQFQSGKVGDTISIQTPHRAKTASGRVLVKQPMADQKIPFQITEQEHYGLEIPVRDRKLSLQNFSDRYLKSGALQIGNVIERSVLSAIKNGTYFSSGTAGTAISSDTFTDAAAFMTNVAVPEDGMRTAIIGSLDGATIDKEMKNKYNPDLVKGAIQKGYLNNIADIDVYRSAIVPNHTVGNYTGTPLVNGASQTGASLVTDGWGTSIATLLNVGDVFTIANVYEVHPQSRQSTGRLQRFTVTATASSNGSGQSTISISPAINDGTLTVTNAGGVTVSIAAYQNVTAAPADNAVITVVSGGSGLTYRQGLIFHRDACTLAMVSPELPETAAVKARITDEESGLTLIMTGAYDISEFSEIYRIDAIWGVKLIYPELAHRLFSAQVS